MLKNSIRIVFSYIDVLSAWNQGSGSSIVLSILAAAILLCASDFSDLVRFYTHDEKHEFDPVSSFRLTNVVKIFCSVFIIIGLLASFLDQRTKGMRVSDKIHDKKSEILKKVNHKILHAKFKIQTNFVVDGADKRDQVMNFVKTLTDTDVDFVRKTFIGFQDCIAELDNVEKVDNTIQYWIRDMLVSYKMFADEETNEFFVKQIISLPPQEWSMHAQREEIKRKYYVIKLEDQKLWITQYTTVSEEHDDDIREFCAFRNIFDRKCYFVPKPSEERLQELDALRKELKKIETTFEVRHQVMNSKISKKMKNSGKNLTVEVPGGAKKTDTVESPRAHIIDDFSHLNAGSQVVGGGMSGVKLNIGSIVKDSQ